MRRTVKVFYAFVLCLNLFGSDVWLQAPLVSKDISCECFMMGSLAVNSDIAMQVFPEVFCNIYPDVLTTLLQEYQDVAWRRLCDSQFYVQQYKPHIFWRMDYVIELAKEDRARHRNSSVRKDIIVYAEKWKQLRAIGLRPVACSLLLNKDLFGLVQSVIDSLDESVIADNYINASLCKAMPIVGFSPVLRWLPHVQEILACDYHNTMKILDAQQASAANMKFDESQFMCWSEKNKCVCDVLEQYLLCDGEKSYDSNQDLLEQKAIDQLIVLEDKVKTKIDRASNSLLYSSCQHYLLKKSAEFLKKSFELHGTVPNWESYKNEMQDKCCLLSVETMLQNFTVCMKYDIKKAQNEDGADYDRRVFLARCQEVADYVLDKKHFSNTEDILMEEIKSGQRFEELLCCFVNKKIFIDNRKILWKTFGLRDSWRRSLYIWIQEAMHDAVDALRNLTPEDDEQLYMTLKSMCDRLLLEEYVSYLRIHCQHRSHWCICTENIYFFVQDICRSIAKNNSVINLFTNCLHVKKLFKHCKAMKTCNEQVRKRWEDEKDKLYNAANNPALSNQDADALLKDFMQKCSDREYIPIDVFHEKMNNIEKACNTFARVKNMPAFSIIEHKCTGYSRTAVFKKHLRQMFEGFLSAYKAVCTDNFKKIEKLIAEQIRIYSGDITTDLKEKERATYYKIIELLRNSISCDEITTYLARQKDEEKTSNAEDGVALSYDEIGNLHSTFVTISLRSEMPILEDDTTRASFLMKILHIFLYILCVLSLLCMIMCFVFLV